MRPLGDSSSLPPSIGSPVGGRPSLHASARLSPHACSRGGSMRAPEPPAARARRRPCLPPRLAAAAPAAAAAAAADAWRTARRSKSVIQVLRPRRTGRSQSSYTLPRPADSWQKGLPRDDAGLHKICRREAPPLCPVPPGTLPSHGESHGLLRRVFSGDFRLRAMATKTNTDSRRATPPIGVGESGQGGITVTVSMKPCPPAAQPDRRPRVALASTAVRA
eukprot:scaffold993_cov393-Prasinococcus_capsulatus_cf.AAC.20